MRFLVALLIASLFVDKADSELSFIPRNCLSFQGLYPCASYSPGVHSQKYSPPNPSSQYHKPLIHSHSITAGEQVKIEKLTLGLGIIRLELMTSTTSRWHSTAELYPFPCPHREIELTNPKARGRETQHHYSWTTWSWAFFSHYYGYENNEKNWIQLSTAPIGNIRAIAHGFIKPYDFPDLNKVGFTWRRFGSACSIR